MDDARMDEAGMAALLASLVARAEASDRVVTHLVPGGCELLAYPVAPGGQVLVGLGVPAGDAHRVDALALLRRRGADMARFGPWLPARLQDGSYYLLRRWPGAAWRGGVGAALHDAQEMFNE